MPCGLCGKHLGPKCEDGQVRYLSGLFPCANRVGTLRGEPDPYYERLVRVTEALPVPTPADTIEDWTV